METRKFKSIEEKVSLLGFGLMRLPVIDEDQSKIDEEKAAEMVREALRGGVNYFDTAYPYHGGVSERFVKKAFKGEKRENYLLASKFPAFQVHKKEEIESIFEEQLQNCGVDYFDFYLIHSLDAETFARMEALGLYGYLAQQKRQGRIRHLGFSFHDVPEVLEDICKAHEWDFAQIQLNYYDWVVYQSERQYEILERYGLPCVVMEPLHGGLLADLGEEAGAVLEKQAPGKSMASWGLRYAAQLPNVLCVLSGMSTLHQMQDNLKTFSPLIPLREDDYKALDEALRLYKQNFLIPCSACRYCMPCPFGVDIPGNFSIYNTCAKDGNMDAYRMQTGFMGETKAASCTNCGACLPKCPQKLDIPGLFAQMAVETEPSKIVHVQQ